MGNMLLLLSFVAGASALVPPLLPAVLGATRGGGSRAGWAGGRAAAAAAAGGLRAHRLPPMQSALWQAPLAHSRLSVSPSMQMGMGMGLSGGLGVTKISRALIPAFVPPAGVPVISWDLGMAVLCVLLSTAWVRLWSVMVQRGALHPTVSRKIVHCGSGPLFLLLWPFFSPTGRYLAAAVPILQAVRLTLAAGAAAAVAADKRADGTSGGATALLRRNPLVAVVSRSGSAKEAVGGPLLYVLVLAAATILEWRTSLVGLMAVSQMAAGDGLADLVGRRCGGKKWWFSDEKSYAGSLAFVVGGTLVSLGLIAWLHAMGCMAVSAAAAATRVFGISAVCALVEAANVDGVDDNVSVPVAAAVLTRLLFPEL